MPLDATCLLLPWPADRWPGVSGADDCGSVQPGMSAAGSGPFLDRETGRGMSGKAGLFAGQAGEYHGGQMGVSFASGRWTHGRIKTW